MMRETVAMVGGVEAGGREKRAGFLDLPRSWRDLTLTRGLWSVGKATLAAVAIVSLGALDETLLGSVLLGASGLGLADVLRRRTERLQAETNGTEQSSRSLAVVELADRAIASRREARRSLTRASALGIAPLFFAGAALITGGVFGGNPLGLSPWPYTLATLFTGLPVVLYLKEGVAQWLASRSATRELERIAPGDAEPNVVDGGRRQGTPPPGAAPTARV